MMDREDINIIVGNPVDPEAKRLGYKFDRLPFANFEYLDKDGEKYCYGNELAMVLMAVSYKMNHPHEQVYFQTGAKTFIEVGENFLHVLETLIGKNIKNKLEEQKTFFSTRIEKLEKELQELQESISDKKRKKKWQI